MEAEGFLISTGAACSSQKKERTRVLEACGVPRAIAACSVRISIGPRTRREELEGLLAALRRRLPGL
jgi:cysteine desulfurase